MPKTVFNNFEFIKELASLSREQIAQKYKGIVIEGKTEPDGSRIFVDPLTNADFILRQENLFTTYSVITMVGSYRIEIAKEDDSITTFFNYDSLNKELFWKAFQENEFPNVEPVFKTWPPAQYSKGKIEISSSNQIRGSHKRNIKDGKPVTIHTYFDSIFKERLEIIDYGRIYDYEYFEINVYIGEITYQYQYKKGLGAYRIDDKPVGREAFIECYNARKAPDKIIHQQPPVKIPQGS
jgi:hypothetical protein